MPGAPKRPAICKDGEVVEYQYDPETFKVTQEMLEVWDWDGCFVVKGLLNKDELTHIEGALKSNPEVLDKAYDLPDGKGRASRLLLWNQPGNDVTGMVARCEKIVNSAEELLGGEVYHYHTKLMMKEPRTGGSHIWHQDYGYWYKNGCLRPDLMTVFIPLDRCNKVNGGLQVVKGTHRCGRIEHDMSAGQTAANVEQVEHLCKHFDHIFTDLHPGDGLFFHCNVLHTSDGNDSDLRRWCFLCSYNRADNDPVRKHHHPNYTPLHKVPNSAILECKEVKDWSGKDIMDPKSDKTVSSAAKK